MQNRYAIRILLGEHMLAFDAQDSGMMNLLKVLVETESPSTDKAAVDRVGAIVADEACRLGADVEIVPRARPLHNAGFSTGKDQGSGKIV